LMKEINMNGHTGDTIIRSNSNIVVQAHISACTMDETGCRATADGTLSVDGICIYEMKNFCFSLQALPIKTNMKKENNGARGPASSAYSGCILEKVTSRKRPQI
jgi:hypothetical protein